MTIEDAQVIDIISTPKDGNGVTLTATDHLEWGDREHLMMLQDKLNSYLSFIESGEIYEQCPNFTGNKIIIDLVCKYPPDEEGVKFLRLCQEAMLDAGFLFTYRVHVT